MGILKFNRQNLMFIMFSLLFLHMVIRGGYAFYVGVETLEELYRSSSNFLFNFIRFNPFINLLEFTLGIILARLFLFDVYEEKNRKPYRYENCFFCSCVA